MNHPEVPPNCPYFYINPLGRIWFQIEPDTLDSYCDCPIDVEPPDIVRPVIAAVARCAWLDVAYDNRAMSDCTGRLAEKRAGEWKKWGRGEKWE
jgi:hypothetical protein